MCCKPLLFGGHNLQRFGVGYTNSGNALALFDFAVEVEDIEHQQAVDDEDDDGCDRSVEWRSSFMAQECVDRRSQEPQLHYNADADQRQQRSK